MTEGRRARHELVEAGGPFEGEHVGFDVRVDGVHEGPGRAREQHEPAPARDGTDQAAGDVRGRRRLAQSVGHEGNRSGCPFEKERIVAVGAVRLAGHQVRRRADKGHVGAVRADRGIAARRVCRGRERAGRVAHESHLGRGPIVEEDFGVVVRVDLPAHQVVGVTLEEHEAAVAADPPGRGGARCGENRTRSVRDQPDRSGRAFEDEEIGSACGVHLAGDEIRGIAVEEDPASIAAQVGIVGIAIGRCRRRARRMVHERQAAGGPLAEEEMPERLRVHKMITVRAHPQPAAGADLRGDLGVAVVEREDRRSALLDESHDAPIRADHERVGVRIGSGHPPQEPRGSLEQEDLAADEGHISPIRADHRVADAHDARRDAGSRAVAREDGDARHAIVDECVVAGVEIDLTGHDVRRRAQEERVPSVVAGRCRVGRGKDRAADRVGRHRRSRHEVHLLPVRRRGGEQHDPQPETQTPRAHHELPSVVHPHTPVAWSWAERLPRPDRQARRGSGIIPRPLPPGPELRWPQAKTTGPATGRTKPGASLRRPRRRSLPTRRRVPHRP